MNGWLSGWIDVVDPYANGEVSLSERCFVEVDLDELIVEETIRKQIEVLIGLFAPGGGGGEENVA